MRVKKNILHAIQSFSFIILLGIVPTLYAQQVPEQDAMFAIPVCATTTYTQGGDYLGHGESNEINPDIHCLPTNEYGGVWYKINIASGGLLRFLITPNDGSLNYDWILFNLTNQNIGDISSNPSLVVSCNASNTPGPTGAIDGVGNFQITAGFPINASIPVSTGEVYYLYVGRDTSQNQAFNLGYQLTFSPSTAIIDCGEAENVQNEIAFVSSAPSCQCGSSTVTVNLVNSLVCTSIAPSDFIVEGPGGLIIPVQSVMLGDCIDGYATELKITTSSPIPYAGPFKLKLVGSVAGYGGEIITNQTYNVFAVPDVPRTRVLYTLRRKATCPTCSDGRLMIGAIGGVPPYQYSLNGGPWQASGIFNGLSGGFGGGPHIFRIKGGNGCTVVKKVTLQD